MILTAWFLGLAAVVVGYFLVQVVAFLGREVLIRVRAGRRRNRYVPSRYRRVGTLPAPRMDLEIRP